MVYVINQVWNFELFDDLANKKAFTLHKMLLLFVLAREPRPMLMLWQVLLHVIPAVIDGLELLL